MDDESFRNWGFYEPSYKGHPCLQLMPSVADRDTKPFLPGRDHSVMLNNNGYYHPRDPMVSEAPSMIDRDAKPFISAGRDHTLMVNPNGTYNPRDCMVSDAPLNLDCVRDSWIHRDKYMTMLPGNQNFSVLSEPSSSHFSMQMFQHSDASKDVSLGMEEPVMNHEGSSPLKKRPGGGGNSKAPKPKKSKKGPSLPKDNNGNASVRRVKPPKKNLELVINGIDMDISGIPIPVCSCTGSPQQCYRWGSGGWQSACCTTTISIYPLPMSTKRRGARIAGRKMSQGAFKKVLEKLSSEGYNFTNPIDLKTHWARHGTNKFVVIK